MSGVIFRNTLLRNWRSMLYWGIGVALLGSYVIFVLPNVDILEQYASLISSMPPVLMAALGVTDTAQMATPEGFLAVGFFGYIMLVMAAYGVIAGLNVTANEEDRGILDVVLSLPVPRSRVILERFLAYALMIVGILLITALLMTLAVQLNPAMTFDTARMLVGVFNLLPASLTVLAFTTFIGALARSRSLAAGIAAGFVVLSYFIDFLGNAASSTAAAALRVVSLFSYYNGGQIMNTGLQWGNILVLLAAAAVLLIGGVLCFERRDIGL